MSRARPVVRPAVVVALADLLGGLLFAAAGKRSHEEHGGLVEVALIAWPFVVGAAAGWVAHLLLRRAAPRSPLGGLWVAAGAVVVGQLLRVATGRGTAASFVVVSAAVLVVLLVGWRLVGLVVRRRTLDSPGRLGESTHLTGSTGA